MHLPALSQTRTALRIIMLGALALCGTTLATAENTQAGNDLARTAHRLSTDGQLTIGYFGGSLTDGSGASNKEKTSWRAQTTEWFRTQFPQAQISEINAAIGGTGSDFGIYRIGDDLLTGKPDLVFVEFTVNDDRAARSANNSVSASMEGIVRRIRESNPKADIVFVYTTMKHQEATLQKGERSHAAKINDELAAYYGIPAVDIGRTLWEYKEANNMDWPQLLPDNVHPNDRGYSLYTQAMLGYLQAQDWAATDNTAHALPPALNSNIPMRGRIIPAAAYANADWQVTDKRIGKWQQHLFSQTPARDLVFEFDGNAIGLLWISADDAGTIEYSVDEAPFARQASWSPYGGTNGRIYGPVFLDPLKGNQLPQGRHKAVFRVAPESHEKSTANKLRILAFIINGDPVQAP